MKLYFVEHDFLFLKKNNAIRDETGAVRFDLVREPVVFGYKLHLCDNYGKELALIRQKVSLLSNKFIVTIDGTEMILTPIANRKEGFYYELSVLGWRTFGNLYECDFAIMSDGQAIANVRKLPHKDGSCCEVTYQDSTKETAILAVAITIECAMEVLNNDAD